MRHVVVPGQLDKFCPWDPLRDVVPFLDVRVAIAGAVQNQRRRLHKRERVLHIRLRVHEDQVTRTTRAECCPAAPADPFDQVGRRVRRHPLHVEVLAPAPLDRVRSRHALIPGRGPRIVVRAQALRIRPVEHEGTCALRVRRREQHAHRPALRVAE